MLLKKILRTFKVYLGQTISMILMIMIGVGIFIGFNMEWKTIEYNVNNFFSDCNSPNYTIYSDSGFTKDDLNKVLDISGVEVASREISFDVSYKEKTLMLNVVDNYKLNTFHLVDGSSYDENKEGIWLNNLFAEKNSIKVGDEVTLSLAGINKSFEVLGLIKQSDYLVCIPSNGSQLMPEYDKYGYFYTTPKVLDSFGVTTYTKLLIRSELSKNEIEDKVESMLNSNLLVLDLIENTSYALADGEREEGVTMALILPWFFLFIGFLSMITTCDRISRNEKTQIGTLKALGFKNRTIILHYLLFPLLIGIVGSLIGIFVGYLICYYIMNPNGMMGTYFDMPEWKMVMPWFNIPCVLLVILILVLVGYFSVKRMLKGSASDALKTYVPSKIKALYIERFKFWDKLSFTIRWNLRDTLHHKARSIMSVLGVVGSTILLFASFSLKESVDKFVDDYQDKVLLYETRLTLNNKDNLSYDEFNNLAKDLASTYNGDYLNVTSVKFNDEAVSLGVYNIKNDTYHFLDLNEKAVILPKTGAFICKRIAKENNLKVGDKLTVSLYGSTEKYEIKVAGIIRSSGDKTIEMSEEYAKEIGYTKYYISNILTKTNSNDIAQSSIISSKSTKKDVMETYNTLMELMNSMLLVLILASVLLGVVVLYNLGIMSYIERYREFATLKVVGFKNKDISKMLVKQNMWMCLVGIVIGIPLGYVLLVALMDALAKEYEIKIAAGVLTYLMSIVFIFAFNFIVSLFIQRKNKKISMVEALKGNE